MTQPAQKTALGDNRQNDPIDALLLRLSGPLRSWGGMSLGDDRWTEQRPTASAVLGLVGACVGLTHEHRGELAQWYRSWTVLTARALRWKTHDGQLVSPKVMSDFQSARNTLEISGKTMDVPVVGRRGYVQDAVEFVALVPTAYASSKLLRQTAERLLEPSFLPSLGRRCNGLSAPLLEQRDVLEGISRTSLAECMIAALQRPGIMSDRPRWVQRVELSCDAGWLDAWIDKRLAVEDKRALWETSRATSVVRKSMPDAKLGASHHHTWREVDFVSTWCDDAAVRQAIAAEDGR